MPSRRCLLSLVLLASVLLCPAPHVLLAQQDTHTPEQLVARGDQLFDEGDTKQARQAYRQAVDLDAQLLAASVGLARVAIEEEAWEEAGQWLNSVLNRDPDNVEARYYRGIVHREIAKFRTLNQRHHWNQAASDFEQVIAQDSLYRDVFLQYGLLKRYHEEYEEAIRLGHIQVRLKPELDEARHELFRFYRHFVNHSEDEAALAWLRAQSSDYAEYFLGEKLRQMDRLQEADAVFERLLARPLVMAVQPVLLSRAKIYYALEQPEKAQAFVERAIAQVERPLEADLVFDDFKYIIHDEELAQYKTLRTPEAYRAFFNAFWAQRDPLPSRPVNVRMAEHYRRLLKAEKEYAYDGFRLWHSDPDKVGALDFPAAYALNQEFNDKGLIFIRHGEPAQREFAVAGDIDFRTQKGDLDTYWTPADHSHNANWLPNESWRYHRPRMDFHFVVTDGAGSNNWRLTPELTNLNMLENLEHWGAPYAEMAAAARDLESIQQRKVIDPAGGLPTTVEEEIAQGELSRSDSTGGASPYVSTNLMSRHSRMMLEFGSVRQRLVKQSREAVTLGLTTDQHTWREEVQPMDMPHRFAAFRGKDGLTRLEVHFALPIGHITKSVGGRSGTTEIELGYALHDLDWQRVADSLETKRLPTSPDPSAALIDFFRFDVPPDSYNVSIHSRPVKTNHLGAYKLAYRVPDFSQPALALSDLLLADHIGPAEGASRFDRGDLHVSPNPFGRFFTHQPVFVYFEIYNLTLGADDQSAFTVEYVLTPEEPRRKILGLFGGSDRPVLSLRVDRTAATTSPVEPAEIDVSKVDPGSYILTVRVTDRRTGETRERSQPIHLVPALTSGDL